MSAKILIAEDEIGIRTALTLLLEGDGYDIHTVKDGHEALEAVKSQPYDLIISDIRMPGLTGMELLEETRKLQQAPEFIMITAYGTIETAIQALKNGARDFLLKPFSNDLLRMTVKRTLKLRELSEENQRLRQLEKMKKEFITMVAHELRTPLTAIKGYLRLVLSGMAGDVPSTQKEYLVVVQQNSNKLQRIVDKMLDMAHLETSEFTLQSISSNILSIMWEAIAEVQESYDKKRLKLDVNLASSLKPIMVDPFRMKQIVAFLLDNAVSFSRPERRIWLSVDRWKGTEAFYADARPTSQVDFTELDDGDYLEISVTDEGPGIPPDKLTQIFENFYQIEDLYIRQVGGMGVGLSLCKKLVELMGGKIWVKSQMGEGCTFSFILPWRIPADSLNEGATPIAVKQTEAA